MSDAAHAHKHQGEQAWAQGRLDEALAHFQQYLRLVPGDVEVRQLVADLLVRLNRRQDAVRAYEHVATTFASGGHLFKSIAISNVIQQLDPENTRTQQSLAEAFSSSNAASVDETSPAVRRPTPSGPRLAVGIRTPVSVDAVPINESMRLEIDVADIIEEQQPPPIDPPKLPRFPLFSQLSADEFIAVLRRVKLRGFKAGELVVKEGDPGASMFAVAEGSVRIFRTRSDGVERVLTTLGVGEFFGEAGVVADVMRMASVAATEPTTLLELTREDIQDITRQHPSVAEVLTQFHHQRLLDNLVRASPLFRPFSVDEQTAIIRAFETRSFQAQDLILRQGQPGDGFYVLLRGRCQPFHTEQGGRERAYPDLVEGDVFGEISLLLQKPCTASVRALTPVIVLRLTKPDFERLVLGKPEVKARLDELSSQRRKRTADLLTAIMLGIESIRV